MKLIVLLLILSTFLPFSSLAQDQSQKPEQKPKTETLGEPPVMEPKATPASTPISQTQPQTPQKPLSTNEDPTMIGKRNINGGIWGKMAGGTDKEIRLGQQLAAQVDKEVKYITDPVITEYINRLGQNIVLHSDVGAPGVTKPIAFTIKVIDSDEINAFALPGGFFYVNRGLITAADNEAELAGVMAHEIAHVAARHAMENSKKGEIINYGILAGILLGGGIPATVLQNGGGVIEALSYMKFTRGAEEEADKLGIQYMWAAGYDPAAMATMFEKLEAKNKKKPGAIARLFTTHPAPADRRAKVTGLAARFPEREEYIINSSEFQKVKAKLVRLSPVPVKSDTTNTNSDTPSGPIKPTLRRRQPAPDDQTDPDTEKPVERKPPTLKPGPSPSPTPEF